ncbi:MAG TPA: hypothetical protein VHA82_16160 [Ramlibacter sp.]|uniref:hypothetical protein n=1 Tax=Ramlibacter sp. TaxID=1917967 RepID=UPI002C9D3113|nr:hypothetical protein [Ramlibacter sp.]HVZ45346.1 hypothetical protein [Ramlibacter sp.]
MARARILFVTYGGGHAQMVVPVARALAASDWAEPVVLGLTTAAKAVRDAGLPLVQFKDFLGPADAAARRWGERLLREMSGATIDAEESIAYLGLSFAERVDELGEAAALDEYRAKGRHAFLPDVTLERILRRVQPDLVVATSSPRAEQAAFIAARRLGIPSVCMIDTFIRDDAKRLGAPGYADAYCVLNEAVAQVLVACGVRAQQVHVTGNPAFDALLDVRNLERGKALRQSMGWQGRYVVLLPAQNFQPWHPLTGPWAEHDLPQRLEAVMLRWLERNEDAVLCLRPRPGEAAANTPVSDRAAITGGAEWPLAPLLYAVDAVVTICSTVGMEGRLAGARLVQVLGTPFDADTPWLESGIADRAVELDGVERALDEIRGLPRHDLAGRHAATPQVIEVLREAVAAAHTQ